MLRLFVNLHGISGAVHQDSDSLITYIAGFFVFDDVDMLPRVTNNL